MTRLLPFLILLLMVSSDGLQANDFTSEPATWQQIVDLPLTDPSAEQAPVDDGRVTDTPADEAGGETSAADSESSTEEEEDDELSFEVKYKKGILVGVHDDDDQLFQLRTNGRIQFRFSGFSRDIETYTDNAGVTIPVRNRGRFDIERARLIFSGNVFNDRWKYFLQLDGDTDRGSEVVFFDYWWGYKYCDPLEIRVGKAKVPGSRQWLLTAFETRLVDRPIATDFFRPDRTQGIWAVGNLSDTLKYQAMVGNGFRTATRTPQQVDNRLTVAGMIAWEPHGKFGPSLVDFEYDGCLRTQFGSSLVYAQHSGRDNSGNPILESRFARLSDGTVLTSQNALAPGANPVVTVDAYDALLITFDAAAKYCGWSIDAEYYIRTIDNLQANGVLPRDSLFQYGGYVEGGRFIVPQTFDWNLRYSHINGDFGSSDEYAFGFGYFPRRDPSVKLTFDATWLTGAPTSVTGSDIIVGDRGMLYRCQFQARF